MNICDVSKHIFSNVNNDLVCEKCLITYLEFMKKLEEYTENYRNKN
jgi:hypothetical protein